MIAATPTLSTGEQPLCNPGHGVVGRGWGWVKKRKRNRVLLLGQLAKGNSYNINMMEKMALLVFVGVGGLGGTQKERHIEKGQIGRDGRGNMMILTETGKEG